MKIRCAWVGEQIDYQKYHDEEWGVPVHDDVFLFELLILEGAQAGLNWYTVLKRRDAYKKAFYNFNIQKCAKLSDEYAERLLIDSDIIKHKLKVYSVRKNAQVTLNLIEEYGSLNQYMWKWVDFKPVNHKVKDITDVPTKNSISEAISKDLRKRGMSFVGPTIIYAYMQAIGMVNDHEMNCFRYNQI